jgi:hypothetical protein
LGRPSNIGATATRDLVASRQLTDAQPVMQPSPVGAHDHSMEHQPEHPLARHATIVAVTAEDDAHAVVRKRAAEVGRHVGSTVILWASDASVGPFESPLPTNWSGDGETEQFGDRLGPNDLIASGHEVLAMQVGELRKDGVDAWGWLPETADATHLATYATEQGASLVLLSNADHDLIADLRDADERGGDGHGGALRGIRIEAVPG